MEKYVTVQDGEEQQWKAVLGSATKIGRKFCPCLSSNEQNLFTASMYFFNIGFKIT